MALDWETILDSIGTVLTTTNVGPVVKRRTALREDVEIANNFLVVDSDRSNKKSLLGWIIYYTGGGIIRGPNSDPPVPAGVSRRNYRYTIDGFYSYDESTDSERVFSDKVYNVVADLEKNITLSSSNKYFLEDIEFELDVDSSFAGGDEVVHTVRIDLSVWAHYDVDYS